MCGEKNGRKKYLKLKVIKPGGKVFQIPYKESAYKISKTNEWGLQRKWITVAKMEILAFYKNAK